MKFKIIVYSLLFGLFIGFQSCEDDDDEVIYFDRSYASEDAEKIVALSLSYSSYGMVAVMNQISNEIQEISECDSIYEYQDTIQGETDSENISYEYIYNETYKLNCGTVDSVQFSSTASQTFDAPRYSYDHELAIDFDVTGLENESESETFNGLYNRTGWWEQGYYNQDYYFDFECEVLDAAVDKETDKIYAGTAEFTLVESYRFANVEFTYKGTVEFQSEDEAKVTFDNGDTFYIDLNNISLAD
ncbi:hypothetical protein GM418_13420 [Maribellus comscasis]|uniref:Uncharacterized protein n=1 Tax=Maribellus comscasis TaxID=2681766 RepID=A0A6I6JNT0_9BACT|nr:hypothetical protein [Maribellus comscasis]QGY44626.1 hypothetical protein GM418_13420 [Maribellus comscasis]